MQSNLTANCGSMPAMEFAKARMTASNCCPSTAMKAPVYRDWDDYYEYSGAKNNMGSKLNALA